MASNPELGSAEGVVNKFLQDHAEFRHDLKIKVSPPFNGMYEKKKRKRRMPRGQISFLIGACAVLLSLKKVFTAYDFPFSRNTPHPGQTDSHGELSAESRACRMLAGAMRLSGDGMPLFWSRISKYPGHEPGSHAWTLVMDTFVAPCSRRINTFRLINDRCACRNVHLDNQLISDVLPIIRHLFPWKMVSGIGFNYF